MTSGIKMSDNVTDKPDAIIHIQARPTNANTTNIQKNDWKHIDLLPQVFAMNAYSNSTFMFETLEAIEF